MLAVLELSVTAADEADELEVVIMLMELASSEDVVDSVAVGCEVDESEVVEDVVLLGADVVTELSAEVLVVEISEVAETSEVEDEKVCAVVNGVAVDRGVVENMDIDDWDEVLDPHEELPPLARFKQ